MVDISISIVSYNTKDLLRKCLTSIINKVKGISFEIIVVDNASTDGTVEMIEKRFLNVKLIKNKKNNFFAKANNQALAIAKGKYFLILNSDTYFIDNSVKKLVTYMEEAQDVGAVEGLELYGKRKIIPTGSGFSSPLIDFYELSILGKRIANIRLLDKYRLKNKDRKKTFFVDVACDAFLCSRTNLLNKIKGYDEHLLLYYTENDLCLRIKKEGFSIVHLGNAKIIHKVSSSVRKIGFKKLDIYYSDMLYFYKKHDFVLSGYALYFLLKVEEYLLKIFRPNINT